MKKLSDDDILSMAKSEFVPDARAARHSVNRHLRLSDRNISDENAPVPKKAVLDLHQLTQDQAWEKILTLAKSGVRRAVIITGASGILKIKFQEWAQESMLSDYIASFSPINNGSFDVVFHCNKKF